MVALFSTHVLLLRGCEVDQTPVVLVDFTSLSQIIQPLVVPVCLTSCID